MLILATGIIEILLAESHFLEGREVVKGLCKGGIDPVQLKQGDCDRVPGRV